MTDVDAILTGARLPEDTVPVCTRGDLSAEWARLGKELAAARVKGAADPRLAGGDSAGLVARLEELRAEVEAATVEFRLRALPRKRWLALVEEHPPRRVAGGEVHEDDARIGVNNDSFFPALIKASTVEPKLRDETWDALLDPDGELLTEQQYLHLARACWNLNKREPDVPFSLAGLLPNPSFDSGSGSPEPSA